MSEPRITSGNWHQTGPVIRGFSKLAGRAMGTKDPQVFLVLGRTKRLFWGWLMFAGGLMPGGKLPRRETELIILRVATLTGSAYERAHHERIGKRAGVTTEDLGAVTVGPTDEHWNAREVALLTAVDELHDQKDLSNASWAALREHLDERRSVEFLLLTGHYEMLATALNTLRIEPDPPRK